MKVSLLDIHKRYGRVEANAGIHLVLEPGKIYGLLGENGAGKSTLMRILAGHTQPDRGKILFDDRPVSPLSPSKAMRMGVGMLYQDPLDFPALKVHENFLIGVRRRGRKEALDRLRKLSQQFKFQLPIHRRVGELTVGERQQLELVRLMDLGAKVLILDEPTTGISTDQKETLFATLKELASGQDRTIVFVTHKLPEALELCHEILVMRHGRLVGRMTPPFDQMEILGRMFGSIEPAQAPDPERPTPSLEPILRLEGVKITGERYVLDVPAFCAKPGEIIGLAGLEGSGQDLLLRGLAGLARVSGGQWIFDGQRLRGRAPRKYRRAGIHFVPAARLESGLFPELNMIEHLLLAFPEQKGRLVAFFNEECVGRFRLQAGPDTIAKALSGGNQQRLLLALIPKRARLLLVEHPTRGLDVDSSRQLWGHLRQRCRNGTVLLFSSADLEEILEHSHRVVVFYDRHITAELPAASVDPDTLGRLIAGQR